MRRHPFAKRRIGVGNLLAADLAMSVTRPECSRPCPSPDVTDHTRSQDDQREWRVEEEQSDEGRCREPDHDIVLERPPADAQNRFEHYGEDCRLQTEEEGLNCSDIAKDCI